LHYDDYEHDPTVCGSCGDTVSTTTWNIWFDNLLK
jgi:hypothetical protein